MRTEYICESCGSRSAPELITKGSLQIELVLWALLLLPGLLYGFWRMATRTYVCRHCKGNVSPLTTAKGKLALKQFGYKPASTAPDLVA